MNKKNNIINNKRGSALLLAMMLVIGIGTMAVSYFRFSRITAVNQARGVNKYIVKEIAEIAVRETYNKMFKDSKNEKTNIFWFLKGSAAGTTQMIELPFTNEYKGKLIPKGYMADVLSRIRIGTFRKFAPKDERYSGAYEGHGMIIIETKALLYKLQDGKKANSYVHEIEEHYDYFISSAVAMDNKGSMMINPLVVRKDREMGNQSVIMSADSRVGLRLETNLKPSQPVIPEAYSPYNRYSLWGKKNLTLKELKEAKIIDEKNKILRLNGIVHCDADITLNGDYSVLGQGVIVANSFTINGGISKSNKSDLCTLYANRGNIKVNTEKGINAALIAINPTFNGTIEANSRMLVHGLVIVDRLDVSNWVTGEHSVVYDGAFKNGEAANRMNVSAWLNYRRINDKL